MPSPREDGRPLWNRSNAWPADHHSGHIQHPVILDDVVYVSPNGYSLIDGEIVTTNVGLREGCHTYIAAGNTLVYRGQSRQVTMWDRESESTSSWPRLRPSCWLSFIPANGMLLLPEGGGGCSCGGWMETSIGFAPTIGRDDPSPHHHLALASRRRGGGGLADATDTTTGAHIRLQSPYPSHSNRHGSTNPQNFPRPLTGQRSGMPTPATMVCNRCAISIQHSLLRARATVSISDLLLTMPPTAWTRRPAASAGSFSPAARSACRRRSTQVAPTLGRTTASPTASMPLPEPSSGASVPCPMPGSSPRTTSWSRPGRSAPASSSRRTGIFRSLAVPLEEILSLRCRRHQRRSAFYRRGRGAHAPGCPAELCGKTLRTAGARRADRFRPG